MQDKQGKYRSWCSRNPIPGFISSSLSQVTVYSYLHYTKILNPIEDFLGFIKIYSKETDSFSSTLAVFLKIATDST